jgi:hypothetical protein
MTLPVEEFLRRFLLHVLPRGFVRIRNFGFLANRRRAEFLPLCFRLLQPSNPPAAGATSPTTLPAHLLWSCPLCGGTMRVVERLSAAQLLLRISASSQPVRLMNPHLQPRISLVLRRAHWFSVSHSSECSMVVRSRLSDVPAHDHSLCHMYLNGCRVDYLETLEGAGFKFENPNVKNTCGCGSSFNV